MAALRAIALRPVDQKTAALVLAIVALNLVDAFATLRHLSYGAEELNPLMLALLRCGEQHFLVVKHLLASLGVLGIAVHDDLPAARLALRVLFPLYTCLALYQIALFVIIR